MVVIILVGIISFASTYALAFTLHNYYSASKREGQRGNEVTNTVCRRRQNVEASILEKRPKQKGKRRSLLCIIEEMFS